MLSSDHTHPEGYIGNESKISAQTLRSVHAAVEYILHNLNKPLTLTDISSHVFISRAYLSISFKRVMGENIKKYIYRKRMEHAKHLLLATEESIQRIALECGYSSPAYFSASFRRYYRTTPRAFRQEAEQDKHYVRTR